MFVRNLLQAGDHATIIPAGVRITLQYNENGSLESVYTGHKDDAVLHSELLSPILKMTEVPNHLPITKGTSFVYGCLYTGDVFRVEGSLDTTIQTHYLSKFLESPSKFHFFAGHIQSYAVAVNSPIMVQRWLKSAGFNVLPSYVIPQKLNEGSFATLLRKETFPFTYPRIQGYIIFRAGQYIFASTQIRQMVVKSIKKSVNYDGYILAEISSNDIGSIVASYADIVNFNIQSGTVLFVNDDNQIVGCHNYPNQVSQAYERNITCEYCGKLITVPTQSTRFTCEDEHCVSVMYSQVNRMLAKLGLATIDVDRLKEFAKESNNIICLPDILDMEEFQDTVVEIDLPKLLEAVVPPSVISRVSDWSAFCNKCNNSIESVSYYLQNPDKMFDDLNLDPAIYLRLHNWLKSSENLLDVLGMFDNPKVKILTTGKRFEGAPIFRGKSIFITGTFLHGSYEDIKAILTSYSALVYDKFNTAVDCVIVGGLHDRTDGRAIQKARSFDIPIFEETEFFNQYDIDTDLASM